MTRHERRVFAWILAVLAAGQAACVYAATDPCAAFAWDVRHERAIFASQPETVAAGATATSAPLMGIERLYRLTLTPQEQVAFAVPPERKRAGAQFHGGLVRLQLAVSGTYRIALSRPFWIDIVQNGTLISSAGFTGSHGCDAPHKIVEYALPRGDFLVQLSGLESPEVDLSVSSAPAAAPPYRALMTK